MTNTPHASLDHFIGCLLGTAIGDARGLPYEGLSRHQLERADRSGTGSKRNRYHFLPGYGMCSDDTEHTFMLGQALLASSQAHNSGQQKRFMLSLAWRLRFWLLGLPASIGLATLRSLCKLWLGFSPEKSGVFSAGNGPAMRAALLGLWNVDLTELKQWVRISTCMTHRDPQALSGALLIAWTARYAAVTPNVSLQDYTHALQSSGLLSDETITKHWQNIFASLEKAHSTEAFAATLHCSNGISGYMWHTVPAVIHTFLRHPQDYDAAIDEIIAYGGDTDSTAAIVGALVGIRVGESGIAPYWLDHLAEYPRSVKKMRQLAQRLYQAQHTHSKVKPLPTLPLAAPAILCRNIFFMVIVLLHGVRRLLPPYF